MSLAFVTVAVLLLIGVALRQSVRGLRLMYIPGSVVAGFVGLGAVSVCRWVGGQAITERTAALTETLSGWPGPLIAVVFATMMLQQPDAGSVRKHDQSLAGRVGRQGLMV